MRNSIWKQFGASIDMLENAINFCPAEHWNTDKKIWYNAYHCLFYLDYYLTMDPGTFSPPAPFGLSEFEEDEMPGSVYSKEELLVYLQYCRNKCESVIFSLTDQNLNDDWTNVSGTMKFTVLGILLYNMRHVQHHAAQINLLLRQSIDDAPGWVREAGDSLL